MSKTDNLQATKPDLSKNIENISQGKDFLRILDTYNWKFHPDADALTATFPENNSPNQAERRRLNKLMDQCIQLAQENIFDPYAWFYFGNMETPAKP